MMGILKYSNGWGHLIMSIVCLGVGVFLILENQSTVGTSLIGLVSAAWFVPGAAKQVASQVLDATNTQGPQGSQKPQGPMGGSV